MTTETREQAIKVIFNHSGQYKNWGVTNAAVAFLGDDVERYAEYLETNNVRVNPKSLSAFYGREVVDNLEANTPEFSFAENAVEVTAYELTAAGLDGIATAADFAHIVAQFETEQFTVEVIEHNDELRIYATRRDGDFDDYDTTPSAQRDWRKITNDDFYMVIGEAVTA